MDVKNELETIRQQNNGFLRPQEVVEFARNPETALHAQFEWDDSQAAEKYRLAQARAIIRVAVIVEPSTSENIRAYVSLTSDRNENGGYRAIAEILNDEILTDKLMEDALKELNTFRRKYNRLKDVSGMGQVLSAINTIIPEAGESQRSA